MIRDMIWRVLEGQLSELHNTVVFLCRVDIKNVDLLELARFFKHGNCGFCTMVHFQRDLDPFRGPTISRHR